MEIPIQQDQEFLQQLYKRYDYLQDLTCELKGKFIEDAVKLGMIYSDDFLGAVLGYPVEPELLSRNHFPFIPAEVNLKLCKYRHLTPVQPWPQPSIGVTMTGDRGHVTGVHSVPVNLKNIGNCQVWYGQDVGFIFEAFLEEPEQARRDFESLINQVWTICEDYLIDQGVTQIFTVARDPIFDTAWFEGYLQRRGYQPITEGAIAWVKH
jgi:hypothetical protein